MHAYTYNFQVLIFAILIEPILILNISQVNPLVAQLKKVLRKFVNSFANCHIIYCTYMYVCIIK